MAGQSVIRIFNRECWSGKLACLGGSTAGDIVFGHEPESLIHRQRASLQLQQPVITPMLSCKHLSRSCHFKSHSI